MKRIIQVGLGAMGMGWAERVAESKQWESVAYVDLSEKNLMAAAARYSMPKRRCFQDFREAFRTVEADAVLDVTPQQVRRPLCTEAFRQGLHVLSEKPLADTVKNACEIVRLAKDAECTFMVAQNYRYQPVMQTARRFISQGKLGDAGYVAVNFHKGPHFGGYREEMAFPLVLDMSIHHFDLMRYLLGMDVKAVQAASRDAPWNWNKGAATAMVQLEMSGGVVVNYCASWVTRGWETDWNADWRFDGAKGALLIEKSELYFASKPDTRRKLALLKLPREHQAALLEEFGKALSTGREPETSGRNNLNSLLTTHAVVRAAKERRRVLISEMPG
jgi:predicted dehydrogenase